MKQLNILSLRRVALIGMAIVLIVDFVTSLQSRGGWGLGAVMLLLFPVAVGVVLLVLMPSAAGTLLRQLHLLVPLGLFVVASKALDWLSAAPVLGALLNPSLPLRFLSISLGLSLGFALHIVLAVGYATWMTATLLNLARTGRSDPVESLPAIRSRFWRVFGMEFIGWAVVMLATAALLLLMPVMGFAALAPLAFFGLGWNFWTAALLPVAVETQERFWPSFRAGVAASRANLWHWWLLLLAQMLLLGLLFFYYSSRSGHTNMSWSVNVFWTGGFDNDCRWYGKLAQALHAPKLPLVVTLLSLLFGAFAVAIKLVVIQGLLPSSPLATPPVIPEEAQGDSLRPQP